jgi:hypothetical protein
VIVAHLEVDLEVGNEEQEHVECQLEDPWQGRDAVDADRRAQISLESDVDQAVGVLEGGTSRLQDGEDQLEGEDLALHIHRIGKQPAKSQLRNEQAPRVTDCKWTANAPLGQVDVGQLAQGAE